MNHLHGLNPSQKEAVTHSSGPLLILAGAGAGKTRVITHRILHLIQQGIEPHKILAVTFTNKAAKEMRERVETLLRENSQIVGDITTITLPFISTFHSLGVDILRENFRVLGISKYFTIFDRSDSIRTIKQALKDAGYDGGQFEPKKILGSISKQKSEGLNQIQYGAEAMHDYYGNIVSEVWRYYQNTLTKENAFDFDDLLLKTKELLENNKEIREKYQDRWSHIHIDEYQDTNKVQNDIVKLLVGEEKNICVVGDLDQCIYTWRNAKVGNMLNFEKDFSQTKTILLEENYRSTKTIIAASNEIISKNIQRQEKKLFTNNPDGEKISSCSLYGELDEAYYITSKVKELKEKNISYDEIAVLYRANFQSRILEEAFLEEKIPYQVLGTRFFDRKEVKDILSFVRLALNPDSITDLKRIINIPARGIGKITLLRIVEGKENECSPAVQGKITDFRAMMKDITQILNTKKTSDSITHILKITGLEQSLREGKEEYEERLGNIYELVNLAKRYDRLEGIDGIQKLITDAALATDQDELEKKQIGVKLMTVHAAKGLEFDVVFITGLEEGLFPYTRVDQSSDTEEERRLFYVALTRARKKVYLTNTQVRTIFGSQQLNIPSEFITDIDEELLINESEFITDKNTADKIEYLNLDEL